MQNERRFFYFSQMPANQPIGVFDSGIGGLTVANALKKLMPKEALVYFGDTAHLPYGDKSPEAIKYYSLKITKFLIDEGCKAIVIACNTASSLAYQDLKLFLGNQIPIYSVIDPVVEYMTVNNYQNIGVIATRATINSNVYAQKIQRIKPDVQVQSLATPLLVPMIEEGFFNDQISSTLINAYLSDPALHGIDSLILGCTHYPLIRNEIAAYYQPKIDIIDNTEIVAQHLQKELKRMNLLNESTEPVNHQFYVSDYTDSFEKSTQLFFGQQIQLNLHQLWD